MSEKTKYIRKVVAGTVLKIEDRRTPSGHYIVNAHIRNDEGSVWTCTFWNEKAEEFMKLGLLHRRIHCEGGIKEENHIAVKFFDASGSPDPVVPMPRTTPESRKAYEELLEARGRVMVPHERGGKVCYWSENKADCVKVNGTWESKIEYVLRVMGGKEVMDQFREFKAPGVPGGVKVDPALYHEKIAQMVTFCAEKQHDTIEYYEGNNGTVDDKGYREVQEGENSVRESNNSQKDSPINRDEKCGVNNKDPNLGGLQERGTEELQSSTEEVLDFAWYESHCGTEESEEAGSLPW